MKHTATQTQPETTAVPIDDGILSLGVASKDSRACQAESLRLLWSHRRFLLRATGVGLLASTLCAFLIPKRYTSTTQLMPPDPQSTSGIAMMAALASKTGGGLGTVAGDLLGLKSSGALFIGVMRSQTSQDHLIQQFDLRKVYGTRLMTNAREKLDESTSISEDRKSGIISLNVTDRSPGLAEALAGAYVEELNSLIAELSTSAAHRERVFLEERLRVVKQGLDDASNELAQFSSKNSTLDIQQEGKAMLDVAANLAGQMVAAQSQLEGLRQIYTDNNPRVQSLNARVAELRKELDKLGGEKDSGRTAAGSARDPHAGMPYPSIRNLPLLGVKYAEYYREAKIQETVFELLTEQYELAKVEEAKETPSVKVLDAASVPEKKSSPPRLLIMVLGTFFASAFALVCVSVTDQWRNADPLDPRKILLQEVLSSLKANTRWDAQNGDAPGSAQQIWRRLVVRKPSATDEGDS